MSLFIVYRDANVTKAAVSALGDLVDVLGLTIKPLFGDFAFFEGILQECLQTDDESLSETTAWAYAIMRRIMNQ